MRETERPQRPGVPGTVTLTFTIVDGRGAPFPVRTAGMMVCPGGLAPSDPCDPMIFGPADADGVARVIVEPGVSYRFTAIVGDPDGWCGGWTSPTGIRFFFSETILARGGSMRATSNFVIAEPPCP